MLQWSLTGKKSSSMYDCFQKNIDPISPRGFRTNNMFVPYRLDLKSRLDFSDCDTEHSLQITFHSTFLKGRSLQRENADKTPVVRRAAGSAGGGAGSSGCFTD